jgi:hypothetical protein
MEPMSFWQLVENSPEWVAVFANVLFAGTTIGVLAWQVSVMKQQRRVMQWQVRVTKWQGRNSARHERTQNNLLRLQLEHELVHSLNAERERILKLTEELSLLVGTLKEEQTLNDESHWSDLQDKVDELDQRLRILDLRAYSDPYGKWFFALEQYVKGVLNAVIEDNDFNKRYGYSGASPNLSTRTMLTELNMRHDPITIRLDIETAIRMEVSDFTDKWDAALKQ